MANLNKTQVDMTDLARTYMYGKPNDKKSINFYNVKNAHSDIEDPIFTGFTLCIDKLHSPLFFTGTGDDYISTDILRGKDESKLAEKIETRLEEVYKYSISGNTDSYEITTTNAKSEISDGMYAGYGLQNKTYLDNVLYGATDYIYMVDKVTTSAYADELGTTDLGDGTPNNKSVYASANTEISTALKQQSTGDYSSIDAVNDLDINLSGYTDEGKIGAIDAKLEVLNDQLGKDSSLTTSHNNNITAMNNAEDAYQKELNAKDETYGTYAEMKKKLNTYISSYDKEVSSIQETLKEYQSTMQTQESKLKNNNKDSEAMNKVEETYNAYKELTQKTFDYTSATFTAPSSFDDNVKELTESEQNMPELVSAFKQIWEVEKTKLAYDQTDSVKQTIRELREKISNKEAVLYGGTGLAENGATNNSLYGAYKMAKYTANNDAYTTVSQQKQSLENAKINYNDTLTYNQKQSEKTVITSNLPSVNPAKYSTTEDYNDAMSKARESRTTYEVPQTVYDMLGFIDGMSAMTTEYPYIMQSITGLEEAYKKYFLMTEPYQGSGDDKITITCFESLDLRVSSMFNKYFNAVYDRQYKRERVPINLRRFNCSVFVHDIRNFRHALAELNKSKFEEKTVGDDPKSTILEIALNYASAIEFKFFDCEISPEDTGNIFENVENAEAGDMRRTNFSFTYGNCIINFLPFADLQKYYKYSGTEITTDTTADASNNEQKKEKTETETIPTWKSESVDDTGFKQEMSNGAYLDRVNRIDDLRKHYKELLNSLADSGDFRAIHDKSVLGNVNNNDYKDYKTVLDVQADSGDFRTIYDKSVLGNVNNNDYKDYIKKDYSVVEDYYRNTVANNLAMRSANETFQQTMAGIAASTGMSVTEVVNAFDLGNVYNESQNMTDTNNIGIVSGNENNETQVNDLGQVNQSVSRKTPINDLGNAIKENPVGQDINTLGNVNLTEPDYDIISDLGNAIKETHTGTNVSGLGNVNLTEPDNSMVSDLGNAINETHMGTDTTIIGNINLTEPNSDIVSDLGNAINENSTSNGVSTQIGNIDGYDIKSSGYAGDLGHLDGYDIASTGYANDLGQLNGYDIKPTGYAGDLGNAYEKNYPSATETSSLGKMNMNEGNSKNITDLGNVNKDSSNGNMINSLGKIDGYEETNYENVNDLGKV